MYSPYSDQHGLMWIGDDTVVQWETIEDEASRVNAFRDFVLSVDHPFEFWGMIFDRCGDNFEHLFPDYRYLILDLMTQNASRWDIDEVVCFFLEIIDDHLDLGDKATSCLGLLPPINITHLEYGSQFLSEMLFQDYHDDLINTLYESASWRPAIDKLLENIGEVNFPVPYKNIFINAAMEILHNKEPVNVYKYAETLAEGYRLFFEKQYLEAIEKLNRFNSSCPSVFPLKVSLLIADCFLRLGWNSEALQAVAVAQNILNPDLQIPKHFLDESSNPYEAYLERLKQEMTDSYWTPESAEIWASTEFLFRIHGRLLGDFGSIINGYGRVVETQLRQRLLPKVRKWITEHGEFNSDQRAYCKDRKSQSVYADADEGKFTLDAWGRLLNDAEAVERVKSKTLKRGDFYYCIAGTFLRKPDRLHWVNDLVEYGALIEKFKQYRNDGSHGSSTKWSAVEKSRELCLEIMKGVTFQNGNLIA